jgi:osmotically-inducible protein OsmY
MRILSSFLLATCLYIPPGQAQQTPEDSTINDAEITSRLNRAIEADALLESADILVVSVNGYVMLAGQALSQEQKQQASLTTAFASDNIRRLINELEIVDSLDSSFEANDQAILDQIIETIPTMSPATITVIHNGVVHLLGQVTRNEGDDVANAISRMSGVKNIRLSYEYIQ